MIYNTISQKVLDGFGQNMVDELDRWREQADEILGQVRIQIRPISGKQNLNLFSVAEVCALPSAILVI